MISSALGVKIAVSKDKLEEERKAMQRAKGTYSPEISVVGSLKELYCHIASHWCMYCTTTEEICVH